MTLTSCSICLSLIHTALTLNCLSCKLFRHAFHIKRERNKFKHSYLPSGSRSVSLEHNKELSSRKIFFVNSLLENLVESLPRFYQIP